MAQQIPRAPNYQRDLISFEEPPPSRFNIRLPSRPVRPTPKITITRPQPRQQIQTQPKTQPKTQPSSDINDVFNFLDPPPPPSRHRHRQQTQQPQFPSTNLPDIQFLDALETIHDKKYRSKITPRARTLIDELLEQFVPGYKLSSENPVYQPRGVRTWARPVRESNNERFRMINYEYRRVPFNTESLSEIVTDIIRNLPTYNQFYITLTGTIEIRTDEGSRDQTLSSNQRMPRMQTAMTEQESAEHRRGKRFQKGTPQSAITDFVDSFIDRFTQYLNQIVIESDFEYEYPDDFKHLRIIVREVQGGGSLITMHPDCQQYLYNPEHHTLCLLYCLQYAGIDVQEHINNPTPLYKHLELANNSPIPIRKIKKAIEFMTQQPVHYIIYKFNNDGILENTAKSLGKQAGKTVVHLLLHLNHYLLFHTGTPSE